MAKVYHHSSFTHKPLRPHLCCCFWRWVGSERRTVGEAESRSTVQTKDACRTVGPERTGKPARPLGTLGQVHLPENRACSDYTKCQGCLWASEPFCSVKYETKSGGVLRGRGAGWGRLPVYHVWIHWTRSPEFPSPRRWVSSGTPQ